MVLDRYQSNQVQRLVQKIYSEPLSRDFLLGLAPIVKDILDIHYFAVCLLPNRVISESLLVSNNPQSFIDVYSAIIDQDFIMDRLVNTGSTALYSDIIAHEISLKDKEFIYETNKIRPVSDGCYIPLILNGCLSGFFAIARAGEHNRKITDNDLEVFNFICGLLSDSVQRSLYLETDNEDTAFFDGFFHILSSGDRIKDSLVELFGEQYWYRPCEGSGMNSRFCRDYLESFLKCDISIAPGDLWLMHKGKKNHFLFTRISDPFIRPYVIGGPQIKVTLMKEDDLPLSKTLLDFSALQSKYGFTLREKDVLGYIYKGYSNRDIAQSLDISEATVKHHVWNIFNKSGVDSRTQLVFKLTT